MVSGGAKPELLSLQSVQKLANGCSPFDALVDRLSASDFAAAAIDAPFSIPSEHIPLGRWSSLIEAVSDLVVKT